VPTMKKLRSEIHYEVQDMPNGARVRVSSENPKAISAIHEFLKFQIRDHQTGDPATISAEQ
jgi:TusA-related sulfurtransferase